MSFESSYDDATNVTFRHRVTMAILKAAQSVASEATGAYPNAYTKRQSLAYRVKNQAAAIADLFAFSICSGGIVTAQSSDSDIEFTVNAQWDAWAGVTNLDKV